MRIGEPARKHGIPDADIWHGVRNATHKIDMVLVGGLVFLFSVVFPVAKLCASVLYSYGVKPRRGNGLITFFALAHQKRSDSGFG